MADVIYLCETCCLANGQKPGAAFAKALSEVLSGTNIDVRLTGCMNLCEAPMALALQGTGKSAYLFSGVRPDDVQDAAGLARLYVDLNGAEISDARKAGRLRHCLVGRLPPHT